MPNLSPAQKAVITARLRDGVSVRAIAAELNINKNTVLKAQPNFL
jgi:DNA-binding NarL/FixJ family response regulator